MDELTPEQIAAYCRKIGSKGGKARAEKLSPERRKEIAKKASDAATAKGKAKGKP